MTHGPEQKPHPGQPAIYEIRVRGHLGAGWSDWFEGFTMALEDGGNTLLTGPVADQAALYGLLKHVRDSGIPLVSVSSVERGSADTSGGKE